MWMVLFLLVILLCKRTLWLNWHPSWACCWVWCVYVVQFNKTDQGLAEWDSECNDLEDLVVTEAYVCDMKKWHVHDSWNGLWIPTFLHLDSWIIVQSIIVIDNINILRTLLFLCFVCCFILKWGEGARVGLVLFVFRALV